MRTTKVAHPLFRKGCFWNRFLFGFTLLEMLVSMAVMALILVTVMSLMSMTSSFYQRTIGKLDSFETARSAFDAMGRSLRQATLLSYIGYDDPLKPRAYQLKSDLHFMSGSQNVLGLNGTGAERSDAVFFQAPLGITDSADLQTAKALLSATGFFIAYGKDPLQPDVLDGKVDTKYRYRLYQYLQPREEMKVYENTIKLTDGIPVSNESYQSGDWFSTDVNDGKYIHPLAENVIALAILPIYRGNAWSSYTWNSRTSGMTQHQMPDALNVVLAVIDEKSAQRLNNTPTAPLNLPTSLFQDPAQFDADVEALDQFLSAHVPSLNYRIFKSVIPLSTSDVQL